MILKYDIQAFCHRLLLTLVLVFSGCLSAQAQCNPEQIFHILPPDNDPLFGHYWVAAGMSGNVAIVGDGFAADNGEDSGAAYLFDTATGQQNYKLLPDDGAEDDLFGRAVAISGTTAIIGALGDNDNGEESGSAYLFDTATGQQIAKLLPDDGALGDVFGYDVAISGTTAIIGALGDDDNGSSSGSAYLFDTTTGQQIAKLLPDDGAEGDFFGRAVAISGTTAIVGAERDDDNGENSGSAYLFDTTTGQQIAKLLPDDGAAFDRFGDSVAISGTTAIVGAHYDDDNGENSGSAYLFDTATGQQIAKLLPDDGAEGDYFSDRVTISGPTAIVGAYGDDDNGLSSGSAYLFDTATGQQIAKLLPDDGAAGDRFGRGVAISGTTVIVTASGDDDACDNCGSIYVFDISSCTGVVEVAPDSFAVTGGIYVSGGIVELAESDNADLSLQRSNSDTQSRTEFEVKAFSPVASPSSLEVTLEGSVFARSQVNQTIELFDYIAGTWELVDTRAATRFTDSTVTVAASGDLSRFIEASTMCIKARVRYQSPVARQQFASNTDQFIWTIGQ